MTDDLIGKGAAAISDLLTMLGVDPDERDEFGGPSTAETLAAAVLQAWCDSAAAMDCSHTTEGECRRCEAIKDCAETVRAMLPPVPPVRGEDGVNNDRDL